MKDLIKKIIAKRVGTPDKEVYEKWKKSVNMSVGELKNFMDSEEGQKAGLSREKADKLGINSGRESASMILKMLPKSNTFETASEKWTPTMWYWARRQNSFISRMLGNKGKLFDENKNKTRKHLSLLIWGHNPKKK